MCPHRCRGSQQSQVIHLVCPVRAFPICTPVSGFHRQICNNTGSSLCVPKLNLTTCTPDTRAARPPDCSCSLKPASCHQVTRRCTAPSVCVLEESRTQFSETQNIKNVLTPEATKFYLWPCGEASQSSSPRNAQWYHQNRWPDI